MTMTMAVDTQQRHLGSMAFEHLPYSGPPQFTNPWATTPSTNNTSHLFPTLTQNNLGLDALAKQQAARANSVSMPYSSIPVSAPSIGPSTTFSAGAYGQSGLLNLPQNLLNPPQSSYGSESSYSASHSPSPNAYSASSSPYNPLSYTQSFQQQQQGQDNARRLSQPPVPSSNYLSGTGDQRDRQNSMMDFQDRGAAPMQHGFGDALDAGRGMVAMSQDITPRNIYGPRSQRGSIDSYGFPTTHSHSSSSSISSASPYPSYYGGSSVESSVSDYSSASECMEPISSRTLPRPTGLLGANLPPAPQSMMSQFNSKVSSSTQKKHKCKVCDKRFTRPSSLQTHMYSHTGEKRTSHISYLAVELELTFSSLCL
ncbi:hypothetical protein MMC16_006272 [Acarospora aff. strigata]|nr:hypothetical protein [Acarospora aff. strigata]